jgi:hypothetical protein
MSPAEIILGATEGGGLLAPSLSGCPRRLNIEQFSVVVPILTGVFIGRTLVKPKSAPLVKSAPAST